MNTSTARHRARHRAGRRSRHRRPAAQPAAQPGAPSASMSRLLRLLRMLRLIEQPALGQVIGRQPDAGTVVDPGSRVFLTVATKPAKGCSL